MDGVIAESDPVAPGEPVLSAYANGNDATDPIPRATANNPTRPTWCA